MISDEPDEDADFDDETLLEGLAGDGSPNPPSGALIADTLPDWPERAMRPVGLSLSPDAVSWFKSTYVDWEKQIDRVLRAWVTVNAKPQPLRLTGPAGDEATPPA